MSDESASHKHAGIVYREGLTFEEVDLLDDPARTSKLMQDQWGGYEDFFADKHDRKLQAALLMRRTEEDLRVHLPQYLGLLTLALGTSFVRSILHDLGTVHLAPKISTDQMKLVIGDRWRPERVQELVAVYGPEVKEKAASDLLYTSETEIVRAVLGILAADRPGASDPIQIARALGGTPNEKFPRYAQTWLVAAPSLVQFLFNLRSFQPHQSVSPAPVYPSLVGHIPLSIRNPHEAPVPVAVYQDPLMSEGQGLLSGRGAEDDPGFILRFWRYLTVPPHSTRGEIVSYFQLVPPVHPPIRFTFRGA